MRAPKDYAVTIVAVGLATALNLFCFAAIYDALFSANPGISDNAVNLLTGWGGGMIGIIGAYVGMRSSGQDQHDQDQPDEPDKPTHEE